MLEQLMKLSITLQEQEIMKFVTFDVEGLLKHILFERVNRLCYRRFILRRNRHPLSIPRLLNIEYRLVV